MGGQCTAVDQEQHAAGDLGLHEAIDLVDNREGFAGAGGHGDQEFAFAGGDGGFDGGVGFDLIGAEHRMRVRRGAEASAGGVEVEREHFLQGRRGVEQRDAAGTIERAADIVEPNHFAVAGIEKRDAEIAKGKSILRCAARISLCLR